MATINTIQKKPCCKCDKGAGIFTCDGCQRSFCRKHSDEHRQELSIEMDSIGQEHDILQRDINKHVGQHPLLSHINTWERESINKIQQVANEARNDLNELIKQNKQEVTIGMNRLTQDLQSSRESEDYTELDLEKWINQLSELRQNIEKSISASLVDQTDKNSAIRFIKVTNSKPLITLPIPRAVNNEKFCKGDEQMELSENNLVVTYKPPDLLRSGSTFGVNQYSVGKHWIRCRIENSYSRLFFIGIIVHSETEPANVFSKTSTVHGWWLCDNAVVCSKKQGGPFINSLQKGDELILTLDCDKREVSIAHDRTKATEQLSVDISKCLFPWKLVVGLGNIGNSIRIIH